MEDSLNLLMYLLAMTKTYSSINEKNITKTTQLVIGNALVVPGPFMPMIRDGAIAIDGSRIVGVGATKDIQKKFSSFAFIDASSKIILPGLFNSHTHVAMGFFRGLGHGKTDMIESFLFPAEKNLTPELLEPLSYSYIFDGLRSGVTSFVDHYYFSQGIGAAFERFGVRGWIGETVADLGGAFPGRASWDRARNLIENSKFSSRIRHVVAPHAADTVSPALLTEIATWARDHKIPLHMHLSQTSGERRRVEKRDGKSPVETAAACGALGPQSLVVHLVSADKKDLSIIAQSKSTIGWCPASTVIYEHLADVKGFTEYEIPLAIGTDCAASDDSSDMLNELKIAGLLGRNAGAALAHLSPDHLLAMATTNPARVLGVIDDLGTLEAGKLADLVVLDIGLSSLPIDNPLANVIYSMGSRDVTHVMIDGNWVIWNRELAHVSHADTRAQYQQALDEIHKRVGVFP